MSRDFNILYNLGKNELAVFFNYKTFKRKQYTKKKTSLTYVKKAVVGEKFVGFFINNKKVINYEDLAISLQDDLRIDEETSEHILEAIVHTAMGYHPLSDTVH